MKKYYITDDSGVTKIIKANNLQDAMSMIEKSDSDELEYLSDEEKQAIEDYKLAIKNTNDVKLLKLYAHILQEEIEHLEELNEAEQRVDDYIKDEKLSLSAYSRMVPYWEATYGGKIEISVTEGSAYITHTRNKIVRKAEITGVNNKNPDSTAVYTNGKTMNIKEFLK